jgi:hypothetical protein
MSEAKERYCLNIKTVGDLLGKVITNYVTELEQTLTDARQFIQNIYNNTDPCTCPAEGDCVCGQDGLLKIMKKIDEVIG